MIDSHIHLDWYQGDEQKQILKSKSIEGFIAVSSDLKSCQKVAQLAAQHAFVFPAFGWHPEQPLPNEVELQAIFDLIREHADQIAAIGEVGLPYYSKKKNPSLPIDPYISILERFIISAKDLDLPIVLHAVYEDADIVCDLLEKHHVVRAHFHWFKGSAATMNRIIDNEYFISVTPDCLYEDEIQQIIRCFPLELIMIETDGPWPFEGPFEGRMTHPEMMRDSLTTIAAIKQLPVTEVEEIIERNTRAFYCLE
ncbi:TatD family hydrolase [Gracilibacillus caseinilyticus]|uniref:TatD family hydrolase n=1 Tax=Gracilibacillus caseinilyticus TaxID=2932256 RepID=A0ABY4ERF7_9BACI|nr:TatD family hydrolase [Gracilibacillus caseinilyticus]UOQ47017.1 TatD family hydrolase [Gracilibacillus caseinilyticus]